MFVAKPIISTVVLALSAQSQSHANHSIEKSAAAEHRSEKNSARDQYRNPV